MIYKDITPKEAFTEVDIFFEQKEPLKHVKFMLRLNSSKSRSAVLHFDVLFTDGDEIDVVTNAIGVTVNSSCSSSFDINVLSEHSLDAHYHQATSDLSIGTEHGELWIFEKTIKGITNIQVEYSSEIVMSESPKVLVEYE